MRPSRPALLHLHLLPADLHFFTLATRRLCTSYPPSCTSYITRRLPLLTGRLATAALAARRPTLAALARHSLAAPHSCTCSTAPPCTTPLSACVFLSVPHQIRARPRPLRGLLPLLHTEVAIAPASCTAYGYVCEIVFGEPWCFIFLCYLGPRITHGVSTHSGVRKIYMQYGFMVGKGRDRRPAVGGGASLGADLMAAPS